MDGWTDGRTGEEEGRVENDSPGAINYSLKRGNPVVSGNERSRGFDSDKFINRPIKS